MTTTSSPNDDWLMSLPVAYCFDRVCSRPLRWRIDGLAGAWRYSTYSGGRKRTPKSAPDEGEVFARVLTSRGWVAKAFKRIKGA